LLDGFGEKMEEGGGEEDADSEGDDEGKMAAEGGLAGAEEPGRGGRGKLHGGCRKDRGEDGSDDPDGGDGLLLI
jgi:hypothetical protein